MGNEVVVKKELHLLFADSDNKETVFKITVPKDNVTLAEASSVGEAFVEKNFLMSSKGMPLVSFLGAQYVVSTVSPIME
ncbi:MAG: DUF2922 domain-containing protein [Veillonella sp.]|uniref:DUF2922 domain-containing protein n=1 Tax=Veillonella sp. TaxID=1926307 RepID=UPI0025EF3122|nr:DUF2922 family protein [Veillonella sp.]MBS4913243.1 DUF2922 domain-containing protein [Veillonella sp.]